MKIFFTITILVLSSSVMNSQIALEYLQIHAESSQIFYGQGQPKLDVDHDGNTITTGTVGGTVAFSDGLTLSNSGQGRDLFIVKRDIEGNRLWHIKLTSSDDNSWISAMKVDNEGNTIITGRVNGNLQLNPQGGAQISTPNNPKGFVAKYSASGQYLWHREFGSTSWFTYGEDLALDENGNVYVTGDMGNDFYLGDIEIFDSATTIYCFKLNPTGTTLWARTYTDSRIGFNEKIVYSSGKLNIISSFSGGKDFDLGPGQSITNAIGDDDLMFLTLSSSSGAITNIGPIRHGGKQVVRKAMPFNDSYIVLTSNFSDNGQFLSSRVFTKINSIADVTFSKQVSSDSGSLGTFDISDKSVFVTSQTNKFDLVLDPTSAITPLVFSGDGYSFLEKEHKSIGVYDMPNIPTDGVVTIGEIIQKDDAIYLSGIFFGNCSFSLDPENLDVSSGRYQKAFIAKYTNCVNEENIEIVDCAPVEHEGVMYDSSGIYQEAIFDDEKCLHISTVNITATKAEASVTGYEEKLQGEFGVGDIEWLEYQTDNVIATNTEEISPVPGQYYVRFVDWRGCEFVSNPLTLPTRRIRDEIAVDFGTNIFTTNKGKIYAESTLSNWTLVPIVVDYPEADTKSSLSNFGVTYKNIEDVEGFTLVSDHKNERILVYDLETGNQSLSEKITTNPFPTITVSDFGYSVASYENFVFVSAPGTDLVGNNPSAGIVQIFLESNGNFEFQDYEVSSNFGAGKEFGKALFVNNDKLYVLESGHINEHGTGKLYQYDITITSGKRDPTIKLTLKGSIEATAEIASFTEDIAFVKGKILVLSESTLASFDSQSLELEDIYESENKFTKLQSNGNYAVSSVEVSGSLYNEALIVTINEDDKLEEVITYYSNEADENYGSGIAITEDNTVLVGADQYSDSNTDGIIYYYSLNDFVTTNTERPIEQQIAGIVIVPNPALTSFSIDIDQQVEELKIFDTMGKCHIITKEKEVDVSSLPTGMYIVKIELENKRSISRKVIKL